MPEFQPTPGLYTLIEGTGQTEAAKRQAQALASGANPAVPPIVDVGTLNQFARPPIRWLYIYNIARREHRIERPEFNVTIPPCPDGSPFIQAGRYPDPRINRWQNFDTGEVMTKEVPGAFWLTDILDPDNLTSNCFRPIPRERYEMLDSGTNDLTRRGVFWSANSAPSVEELRLARERMEFHYRALIRQADLLARNPRTADQITPEHHLAAEYFPMPRHEWHIIAELPTVCENCGQELHGNPAVHPDGMGGRCVRDWVRALAAGLVKREEVPDGFLGTIAESPKEETNGPSQ